jgi:hypothetical protein
MGPKAERQKAILTEIKQLIKESNNELISTKVNQCN